MYKRCRHIAVRVSNKNTVLSEVELTVGIKGMVEGPNEAGYDAKEVGDSGAHVV
jgi:hypothetical protein